MRMNLEKLDSDSPDHKSSSNKDDEDREVLPGFRFHPTDEELVGFYLLRKVENKPPVINLIKQVDVYKYDPWDLPMSTIGDKEWYFFCIRGRKYRNSVRPNRVAGSGFWKATGIDKPIYSSRDRQDCIGLKKSLVYYRGSAGKGTKTDWMMHEFRLPPSSAKKACPSNSSTNDNVAQEAEVWTICRILKRMASHRKYTPTAAVKDSGNMVNNGKGNHPANSSSKTSCYDSGCSKQCVSFGDSLIHQPTEIRNPNIIMRVIDERRHPFMDPLTSLFPLQEPFTVPAYNYPPASFWNVNGEQDFHYSQGNWDELRLVVDRAIDPSFAYDCRMTPPHDTFL